MQGQLVYWFRETDTHPQPVPLFPGWVTTRVFSDKSVPHTYSKPIK